MSGPQEFRGHNTLFVPLSKLSPTTSRHAVGRLLISGSKVRVAYCIFVLSHSSSAALITPDCDLLAQLFQYSRRRIKKRFLSSEM